MRMNIEEQSHVLIGLQIWQRKLKKKVSRNDHHKNGSKMPNQERAKIMKQIQIIDSLRARIKSS
jgi:hypothetical protein